MTQKTTQKRASTSRLEPGEHTIDRSTPRKVADGKYWLDWTVHLEDGRKLRRRAKGKTKGETRRRAKEQLRELQATGGQGPWKTTDLLVDYMQAVTRPAIERARLAPASRKRYLSVLRVLFDECTHDEHVHEHSLSGHTIAGGTRFRVLESCLIEIAELHGSETAHQARSVLGKYVLDQLIRDDLIGASPIAGKRIDLSGYRITDNSRGGIALTANEWNAVIDHLLTRDPSHGVPLSRRGMYTHNDRVAVWANAIDLTLLQAFTGMRVDEACRVRWSMVTFTSGVMVLNLTREIVKTNKGRRLPIEDPDVVERFRARRMKALRGDRLIIGSPAKPESVWDQKQRSQTIAKLYVDIAQKLGIPALLTERSHVWRTTLNTLAMTEGVAEAIRVTHLGHTPEINREHYTDASDGSPLSASLTSLRTRGSSHNSTHTDRDYGIPEST